MMKEKINPAIIKSLYVTCFIAGSLIFSSCSVSKQVGRQANTILLHDSAISKGHIGICIYEPSTGKYWYKHDAEKYFVPASNTKLFSLYAGLKYLGDSVPGLEYFIHDSITEIFATGDPTFLHPDFNNQPVLDFLNKQKNIIINNAPYSEAYGPGWAWDDHMDSYMAPRSSFPMYGNVVQFKWINEDSMYSYPHYLQTAIVKNEKLKQGFLLAKKFGENTFSFVNGTDKYKYVPFLPDIRMAVNLLNDTLKIKHISYVEINRPFATKELRTINSRYADSLFIPMMHNSDNFFAEQTLLMVSNKRLGVMDDERIISSLLSADLKDIPQKPQWVDGSGLSRHNMFTPQSFVYILGKLKKEFGFERIKNILPTGGTGTLKNYYNRYSSYIYAKTGTLSNHVALSGYLITKNKKTLIFSILANHFQTGPTPVRKAIEHFLEGIINKF